MFNLVSLYPGSAQAPADLAGLRGELAIALDFRLDDTEAGPHALADHRALEVREGADDLEEKLARRRGGVEVLLIKVEVDPVSALRRRSEPE
jgi:hypothetical protein